MATLLTIAPVITNKFQSTPPIRVATCDTCTDMPSTDISIHATHTGGDYQSSARSHRVRVFQSTPPIRVATVFPLSSLSSCLLFQSTPPIRVATLAPMHPDLLPKISIHATHTGGDKRCWLSARTRIYFNPRHPYGWRRVS